MNKNVFLLVLVTLGLFACRSTPPEVTYFEQNYGAMNAYNTQYGEEIGVLTSEINAECVFKRMEKNNMSMAEVASIPLSGVVIYDISADGTITSALYVTKDKGSVKLRKQECIENVALGFKLPPSPSLEKVFTTFTVNFE